MRACTWSLLPAAAVVALAADPAPPLPPSEPPVELAEVVVTPSRFGVRTSTALPQATLTSRDLETLPQVGEDLYRSIGRLPGVAADDFTARFWIRGAPNGQLLARLDGVDLIEPFHLKDIDGALSVVDLPSIGQLDLITGGFTAEYGDRLAGVLAMETTTAPAGQPGTSLGLSLTGVRASVRGRTDDGRAEWRLTARRGYPDLALKLEGRDDEVFPRYYDVAAKAEWQLGPRQRLGVHALRAGDTLRFRDDGEPELRSRYDSDYLWVRWRGETASGADGEIVASWSALTWKRDGDGAFDDRLRLQLQDDRSLDVLAVRAEGGAALAERVLIRAGAEVRRGAADYRYRLLREDYAVRGGVQVVEARTASVDLSPEGTAFGAFVSPRFQVSRRLVVEPGMRFDRDAARGEEMLGPRLNAAWTAGSRTVLRVAWGRHHQAQGLQELSVPDGETGFRRAERAEHRVAGLEHRLDRHTLLRAEVYQRIGSRIGVRWENVVNGYNLFPEVRSDRVRSAPAANDARGIEILVSRTMGSWSGAASYGLARAEETVGDRTVPRARDQRHTVFLNLSYAPRPEWSLSASWQYHSGWPVTEVGYVLLPLNNGRRFVQRVVGPPYGGRLPAYHRLDLRATRRFHLRRGELRAFVDLFNAYDRTNLIGYDWSPVVQGNQVSARREGRDLLPILPSVGVEWAF
jgi:outer membrane cobalamin receptor